MRERIVAALLVVAAIAFVFFQLRGHGFVDLSDPTYVLENPRLLEGFTPATLWLYASEPYAHEWIPLTWISLHLDHLVHGRDASGYLLTNVVLHTLSSLLLLALLLRLTGAVVPSAFVALVFAVHPLHVEAVAWVSARKDALSGLFFMLTLLAYARYADGPARTARMLPVAALLLLGLMAKPMLVTAPLVLLLLDFWPLGRMRSPADGDAAGGDGSGDRLIDRARLARLVVEKLPLFAIALAVSAATFAVHTSNGVLDPLERLPFDARLANALTSYVVYLSQTVLPQGLAVLYPHPETPDWRAAGAAALLLLGATVVAASAARERPHLLVGWLWFVVVLVPVIGLVQVGLWAHADRYTDLPQIGLTIALAWGAADVVERTPAMRSAVAVVGTLVVAWLAGLAFEQTKSWRDTDALYVRALNVTEGNHLAHEGLADALLERGRFLESLLHYQQANMLRPSWMEAALGIADVFALHGGLEQARPIYEAWIEAAPGSGRPAGALGLSLLREGRFEEALSYIEAGLAVDPGAAALHAGRGAALFALGREEEAREAYREALYLDPGEPTAATNLARLLAVAPDPALRRPAEAVRIAETAAQRAPQDPLLLDTLAAAYAAAGHFGAAVATSARAAAEAEERGREALAAGIRARTKLYREGRPYLEEVTAPLAIPKPWAAASDPG